jgi:cytochrome c-type biogenesis protein CcmH/NrfF
MIPMVVVPQGAAGKAYEQAATALLCDCGCNPQSIKECACSRAEELRVSLAADAASGKTGEQIIAAYVARHGQKILVSPPASGFNLVAWIGPAVGLLAATIVIVAMIGRWRRSSRRVADGATPPPAAPEAADLARLAKDLEEMR